MRYFLARKKIKMKTPITDEAMTDGWSGDAWAVDVETCKRLERDNKRMRRALKDLSQPVSRVDYSLGDLDRVVCKIAKSALDSLECY